MTTTYSIITPTADVRTVPDASARRGKLESELVFGEVFVAGEEKDGWCRGYCAHDGYEGWIEKKSLGVPEKPTHIVTAARSPLYREDSVKSQVMGFLSLGSRVRIVAAGKKHVQLADGRWLYASHLLPADAAEPDHVATAMKFVGTPYLWGGRSAFGIDCSGLVQVCLARAGIAAPRDTDEQREAIGLPVAAPRAGDIVFFENHVAIMTDGANLISAEGDGPADGDGKGYEMRVVTEALRDTVARRGDVTAFRRP